ncbi:hypothetical protein V8E53_001349 [Lactarius tabidus]
MEGTDLTFSLLFDIETGAQLVTIVLVVVNNSSHGHWLSVNTPNRKVCAQLRHGGFYSMGKLDRIGPTRNRLGCQYILGPGLHPDQAQAKRPHNFDRRPSTLCDFESRRDFDASLVELYLSQWIVAPSNLPDFEDSDGPAPYPFSIHKGTSPPCLPLHSSSLLPISRPLLPLIPSRLIWPHLPALLGAPLSSYLTPSHARIGNANS